MENNQIDKNILAIEIQTYLKDMFKDSNLSVCDNSTLISDIVNPLTYDPIDLNPVILIMEKTKLGNRLRYELKITDVLELINK